jgi:error-prone DNA polymerase
MEKVVAKLEARMREKGVEAEKRAQIISAIESFALYGFPESHAISFALLAYASAWLKVHRPAEFFAGLLNNQPMGFYSSDTLLKDAKRHGIRTRPVCVRRSDWRCTLEDDRTVRLGLCVVQGVRHNHAEELLRQRQARPFASLDDFKSRVPLDRDELRALAEIGALNVLSTHRRAALWEAERAPVPEGDLFAAQQIREDSPLAPMTPPERLETDYRRMCMTTGPHPMALIRAQIPDVWRASDLPAATDGTHVRIAGAVICRQRPGTAKGFMFISLEDETGVANAIVMPRTFEEHRLTIVHEGFLSIVGRVQHRHGVIHVKAESIEALDCRPAATVDSHDFC